MRARGRRDLTEKKTNFRSIHLSGENFSRRGDFSVGVNMGSDSIPPKLSDEIVNRGLVCAHMHSIEQTQKSLTFMS